ncbi:protein-lysine N-methyltransferase mettl10-like isoform X2 [Ananas comosus]|uniref:Protein-lysine N-methyltransferase mettl10-like isoform X2 n=1 Tax=Ananas comosus TaxID=4615 RepID=A0A6P5FTC0_ANACO|nr:protein-lysine N-methyltransferase mettl10-like isoform X2 [Ananas comosus]
MAGIRWPPEESDLFPGRPAAAAAAGGGDVVAGVLSDDDRSVAADSWSIKSDYGSTLDDDQRHADAADVLSTSHFPPASDYSSDKDVPDATDVEPSMVGLQNYWDDSYSEDRTNFQEQGHAGEIWFGAETIDVLVGWTKNLCVKISEGQNVTDIESSNSESSDIPKDLSSWSVLDVGTGNGLLLQELAKQGFSDLTGTDYSEEAIEHARNLAVRNGFSQINFLVDDVLETKLERKFRLVNDKYTLDAIGLHPDGHVKRMMYWESVAHLVVPGGILHKR